MMLWLPANAVLGVKGLLIRGGLGKDVRPLVGKLGLQVPWPDELRPVSIRPESSMEPPEKIKLPFARNQPGSTVSKKGL